MDRHKQFAVQQYRSGNALPSGWGSSCCHHGLICIDTSLLVSSDSYSPGFTTVSNCAARALCLPCSDPHNLLARTAHAAGVHPDLPSAILLSAGYGPEKPSPDKPKPTDGDFDMLNDCVLFDTQR